MEKMATTDGLTGLYNRRHFQKIFSERLDLAARYGRKMSVILCDIDHFKSVNDTYGHPAGDAVLRVVAKLLSSEARKTDAIGRLGGEEFAIVMEETDTLAARQSAERIRLRIMNEVIAIEHGSLTVTLSLGIATFPDDGKSVDLLLSHADEALYRAKHGGRNKTVAHSDGTGPVRIEART
jgi:diguanylate cyclase (GGDEF)-like protein